MTEGSWRPSFLDVERAKGSQLKRLLAVLAAALLGAVIAHGAFGNSSGSAGTHASSAAAPPAIPARALQQIRLQAPGFAFVPTWIPAGFRFQKILTSRGAYGIIFAGPTARDVLQWGVSSLVSRACNGYVDNGKPYKAIRVAGHTSYWKAYTKATSVIDIGRSVALQTALRCDNTPSGVFRLPNGTSAGIVAEMMTAATTDPVSRVAPTSLARMVSSARWMGAPAQP